MTGILLLNIEVTEESSRYWKIDWDVKDLSKLRVELKNEFNASKGDLLNLDSRLIGSI
jgi:hypothetical protein